ncbi:MAG: hypothetical protein ACRD3M_01845 [Thermoanaerobaculia bacterium]
MHAVLSLTSVVLPILPTAFLSRLAFSGFSPAVRFLLQVVTYTLVVLLPVQCLAAMEIADLPARPSLQAIAVFQVVLASLCLLGWLTNRPRLASAAILSRPASRLRFSRLTISCIAVMALCYVVFALDSLTSYPHSWDGNVYHLPMAVRWLQESSLRVDSQSDWRLVLPATAQIPMMILLGSRLSSLVFLAQILPLIGLAVAAAIVARRLAVSREASVLAAIIVLSIPIVIHQTFSAYVDLFGSSFLMIALALFLSRGHDADGTRQSMRRNAVLLLFAALSCGVALGTKVVFVFYAAAFAGTALVCLAARPKIRFGASPLMAAALLGVGLLLPSAFWFIRTYGAKGNPFFPIGIRLGDQTILSGPLKPQKVVHSDHNDVKSLSGLATYPWTESRRGGGRYSVDSGLGAPFATFVPLGLAVLSVIVVSRRYESVRVPSVLLFWLVLGGLTWRFGMGSVLRFGLPLICLSCVLSSVLLEKLVHDQRPLVSLLLIGSFATTSAIAAFDPLRAMVGRVRRGTWTHRQFYALPDALENLPKGARVLNWTNDSTLNFPLAGEHLQNRVVNSFEAPSRLTAGFLRASGVDYVVERGPRRGDSDALSKMGAVLVERVAGATAREDARSAGWRVWKLVRQE